MTTNESLRLANECILALNDPKHRIYGASDARKVSSKKHLNMVHRTLKDVLIRSTKFNITNNMIEKIDANSIGSIDNLVKAVYSCKVPNFPMWIEFDNQFRIDNLNKLYKGKGYEIGTTHDREIKKVGFLLTKAVNSSFPTPHGKGDYIEGWTGFSVTQFFMLDNKFVTPPVSIMFIHPKDFDATTNAEWDEISGMGHLRFNNFVRPYLHPKFGGKGNVWNHNVKADLARIHFETTLQFFNVTWCAMTAKNKTDYNKLRNLMSLSMMQWSPWCQATGHTPIGLTNALLHDTKFLYNWDDGKDVSSFEFIQATNLANSPNKSYSYPQHGNLSLDKSHSFHNGLASVFAGDLRFILHALACINSVDTTPTIVRPPINKTYTLYNNRVPTSDYYVLKIDPTRKRIRYADAKGFGSPKRQHRRRGHYRRLPSGKSIWIDSMVCGNPELGSINKDYEVISK